MNNKHIHEQSPKTISKWNSAIYIYIYHDQVGHNPGMQGWYDILKLIKVIHIKGEKPKDHVNCCFLYI